MVRNVARIAVCSMAALVFGLALAAEPQKPISTLLAQRAACETSPVCEKNNNWCQDTCRKGVDRCQYGCSATDKACNDPCTGEHQRCVKWCANEFTKCGGCPDSKGK